MAPMAEWFEVFNVIRNRCVDPASLAERAAVYADLLAAHPEHAESIRLQAQQRDSLRFDAAPTVAAPVAAPAADPVPVAAAEDNAPLE